MQECLNIYRIIGLELQQFVGEQYKIFYLIFFVFVKRLLSIFLFFFSFSYQMTHATSSCYRKSILNKIHITGWPKSHAPEKKLNISIAARANEPIFLSMIETCPSFISIKTCSETSFVNYIVFFFLSVRSKIFMLRSIVILNNGSL